MGRRWACCGTPLPFIPCGLCALFVMASLRCASDSMVSCCGILRGEGGPCSRGPQWDPLCAGSHSTQVTQLRSSTLALVPCALWPVGVVQSEVVVRTSYADQTTFSFSRVFTPHSHMDDVFMAVLPVVRDCVKGINGAVLVRGGRVRPCLATNWRPPRSPHLKASSRDSPPECHAARLARTCTVAVCS